MQDKSYIVLSGVTENNLKNINVSIERNKITAITGVSGSGKSSLAFDTIHQLGKSAYLQALSDEGFLMRRPQVVATKGMIPTIAIAQSTIANNNPRSTVGTLLRINPVFRVLFSLAGTKECPHCKSPLHKGEACKCGKYTVPIWKDNKFSFNHPNGMCPKCGGLGRTFQVSLNRIIKDENATLEEICKGYTKDKALGYISHLLENGLTSRGIDLNKRFCDLNEEEREFVLFGSDEKIEVIVPATKVQPSRKTQLDFHGLLGELKETYRTSSSEDRKKYIEEHYMDIGECDECNGKRLNKEALSVKINGKTISDVLSLSMYEIIQYLNEIKDNEVISKSKNNELQDVIDNLIQKVTNIIEVGLDYITFERQISTLSGGETQRLKLSNYLGIDLTNILYIFDEPSSGLHYKDIDMITVALKRLRDMGNTIIVVEHNQLLIRQCDNIIDIGPLAGVKGGEIVAQGTIEDVMAAGKSLTAKYLGSKVSKSELKAKKDFKNFIKIKNANVHNLKDVSVDIPLNSLVCITGVSGSGKSTLIHEVLYPYVEAEIKKNGECNSIKNVSFVSQKLIGRQKRSIIATYTGLYDKIKNLYSKVSTAKISGIKKADFGINSGNGRCEKCKGLGVIEQDIFFMSNLNIVCDECNGKRFKDHILEVKYKGYSISDLLDLTIEECIGIFKENKDILQILSTLQEIGLGYLKLGQDTVTLSGGECQRLKLVNELGSKSLNSLYIFDEPSAGLHPYDVEKLNILFRKMVNSGASLLIIEHNMDIILRSDYLVDLGPGGGIRGGQLVAAGTPLEVMENANSYTGQAIRSALANK